MSHDEQKLKAVIGLGNPGREYEQSRHNVGFMVAQRLVSRGGGRLKKGRGDGVTARVELAGTQVLVGMPHTYMNLSGQFVQAQMSFYRLAPPDILIVYDEMDLPPGRLRLARGGGTAGHRGMESIVGMAGRNDFPRLRVGIGKPPGSRDTVDWVLTRVEREHAAAFEASLEEAVAAVETWVRYGIEVAMNRHNHFIFENT